VAPHRNLQSLVIECEKKLLVAPHRNLQSLVIECEKKPGKKPGLMSVKNPDIP
jgi:hypothetical protein